MQGEKHQEGFNLMIYSVLTKNLESSTSGGQLFDSWINYPFLFACSSTVT